MFATALFLSSVSTQTLAGSCAFEKCPINPRGLEGTGGFHVLISRKLMRGATWTVVNYAHEIQLEKVPSPWAHTKRPEAPFHSSWVASGSHWAAVERCRRKYSYFFDNLRINTWSRALHFVMHSMSKVSFLVQHQTEGVAARHSAVVALFSVTSSLHARCFLVHRFRVLCWTFNETKKNYALTSSRFDLGQLAQCWLLRQHSDQYIESWSAYFFIESWQMPCS